jgi:hypothetical protein
VAYKIPRCPHRCKKLAAKPYFQNGLPESMLFRNYRRGFPSYSIYCDGRSILTGYLPVLPCLWLACHRIAQQPAAQGGPTYGSIKVQLLEAAFLRSCPAGSSQPACRGELCAMLAQVFQLHFRELPEITAVFLI